MNILSAGMHRSGSTWLFNALRHIIESENPGSWFASITDTPPDIKNAVVKIHAINKNYIKWADYIFYSYRDIRDVEASFMRRRGETQTKKWLHEEISGWVEYTNKADLVIEYNRIINEPEKVIAEIGKIVGIKPNIEMILKELFKMRNKKLKNTDPVTLMRVNHITDGRSGIYKQDLDPEYLKWIEDKYGWWLIGNGYKEA